MLITALILFLGWIPSSSIHPDYQFTGLEVLESGDVCAALIHKSSFLDLSFVEIRKNGQTEFQRLWSLDSTSDSTSRLIKMASLGTNLYIAGLFGHRSITPDGNSTELICADTTRTNTIHPIDSATVILTGGWRHTKPNGSSYTTYDVVINSGNSTCTEVYSSLARGYVGYPNSADLDLDGTPYFCLEQRREEGEDTLVRTVDGLGVAITGLVDPHKYDPKLIRRYRENWVLVVQPTSGYYHPVQIIVLDRSFNLLTAYELKGKDQRIMETKLVGSRVVVCQSHYITVYDIITGKAVEMSFDDVIGSHPVPFGQQLVDADLFGTTLYACIAEAIITIPDVITSIEESHDEIGATAMIVTRDEEVDIRLAASHDIHSVRLYSVQGECRTVDVRSIDDRIQIRGADLWPGYNLVVFADRSISILCIKPRPPW